MYTYTTVDPETGEDILHTFYDTILLPFVTSYLTDVYPAKSSGVFHQTNVLSDTENLFITSQCVSKSNGIFGGSTILDDTNNMKVSDPYLLSPLQARYSHDTYFLKAIPPATQILGPYEEVQELDPLTGLQITRKYFTSVLITKTSTTVVQAPPEKPLLISPVNTTINKSNVTFIWSCPTADAVYDLYLNNVKVNAAPLTILSYTLPYSLLGHTTYTWKVIASNAGGTAESDVATFNTLNTPPTVTYISPAPNASVPRNVALVWSTFDADGDAVISNLIFGQVGQPLTTYYGVTSPYQLSNLMCSNINYQWQIIAHDAFGGVATGAVRFFSVANGAVIYIMERQPTREQSGRLVCLRQNIYDICKVRPDNILENPDDIKFVDLTFTYSQNVQYKKILATPETLKGQIAFSQQDPLGIWMLTNAVVRDYRKHSMNLGLCDIGGQFFELIDTKPPVKQNLDPTTKYNMAIASGKVVVQKLSTGEVTVMAGNNEFKQIKISNNKAVELTSIQYVTSATLKTSNLLKLVQGGLLDIVI